MKKQSIYKQLQDLGLNMLESEVYIELLTSEPMTAYRIAKRLNKATANVYKAIDLLAAKGAVIVEDNTRRICKAVNPEEFIGHLEKSMLKKTSSAKETLNNLGKTHYDERTYTIDSVDLVFAHFESLLQKAKHIVTIDIFPEPYKRVEKLIKQAIDRGIRVYVESYKPIKLPGAHVAHCKVGEHATNYWKSQQMNLVVDGEAYLMSLMDNKLSTVLMAQTSNNLYMSCMLMAGAMREHVVMQMMDKIDNHDFCEHARNILTEQSFFFNTTVPGLEKLFKLYARKNES